MGCPFFGIPWACFYVHFWLLEFSITWSGNCLSLYAVNVSFNSSCSSWSFPLINRRKNMYLIKIFSLDCGRSFVWNTLKYENDIRVVWKRNTWKCTEVYSFTQRIRKICNKCIYRKRAVTMKHLLATRDDYT